MIYRNKYDIPEMIYYRREIFHKQFCPGNLYDYDYEYDILNDYSNVCPNKDTNNSMINSYNDYYIFH